MPFGTIALDGGNNFQPRDPGIYMLESVDFGEPKNFFRFRPAVRQKGSPNVICSLAYVHETEVTVGGTIVRQPTTVTTTILTPASGIVPASVLSLRIGQCAAVLTADRVGRLLLGER